MTEVIFSFLTWVCCFDVGVAFSSLFELLLDSVFVGSGLGEANTVKTQEGLFGLDLDEIAFRQSAIGVSTRKALETASARIVARMIRKGIFEN